MKQKKYIVTLILFFLSVSVVVYLYIERITQDKVVTPNINSKTAPVLESFKQELEVIEQLTKTQPELAKKKREALIEKLPAANKRYFDFGFKAGIEVIDFYGQVVDQQGVPVSGATVGYSVGGRYLAKGGGRGATHTDAQGRFEIHSQGGSLTLYGITHPEIDFQFPVPNLKYTTMSAKNYQMSFYGYQHAVGGSDPLWTNTTPTTPYIFAAWRVGKYEKVKSGGVRGFIRSDGRIYTFDLNKREKRDRVIEGVTKGHLNATCERSPAENIHEDVDWRVTITPVDGGIQKTDDLYMNLAPETGYQPSLIIDMKKGELDYKRYLANQRYFFYANNGQVYGSLFVHFEPYIDRDTCRILVGQYKINSNGSRNLAIKPR